MEVKSLLVVVQDTMSDLDVEKTDVDSSNDFCFYDVYQTGRFKYHYFTQSTDCG